MLDKILEAHPDQLESFRAGKTKIQGFFSGWVHVYITLFLGTVVLQMWFALFPEQNTGELGRREEEECGLSLWEEFQHFHKWSTLCLSIICLVFGIRLAVQSLGPSISSAHRGKANPLLIGDFCMQSCDEGVQGPNEPRGHEQNAGWEVERVIIRTGKAKCWQPLECISTLFQNCLRRISYAYIRSEMLSSIKTDWYTYMVIICQYVAGQYNTSVSLYLLSDKNNAVQSSVLSELWTISRACKSRSPLLATGWLLMRGLKRLLLSKAFGLNLLHAIFFLSYPIWLKGISSFKDIFL